MDQQARRIPPALKDVLPGIILSSSLHTRITDPAPLLALLQRFDAFGATPAGGVIRLAGSEFISRDLDLWAYAYGVT